MENNNFDMLEERAANRAKAAAKARSKRAAETDEEREIRRAKSAAEARDRRAAETDEERTARRMKDAARARARRAAKRAAEPQDNTRKVSAANKRAKNASRMATTRAAESEETASQRRDINAAHMAATRAVESEEISSQRRAQDASYQRERRREESQDEGAQRRQRRAEIEAQRRSRLARQALFPVVATIDDLIVDIQPHSLGPMDKICSHCGARMWKQETKHNKAMCCCNGAVKLAPPNEFPLPFRQLWSKPDFLQNIRAYNNVFAFTSLGAKIIEGEHGDRRYTSATSGVYTFRIQGSTHHLMGSLMPNDGTDPKFAQVYVYDGDMEAQIQRRGNIIGGLNEDFLRVIQQTMTDTNPWAKRFLSAGDLMRHGDVNDFRLVIHANHGMDLRTHNKPSVNEVAAIIADEGIDDPRDVVVHLREDGRLQRISDIHPGYDPLQFPLLYPFGEYGWSPYIEYANDGIRRRSKVSCKEFYAYKSFEQNEEWSVLHHSGRLCQQYFVEQFAKIELQRLRLIRKDQGKLRADLYAGVVDAIARDCDLGHIGRYVLLPPTFTGGERYMRKQYLDAMSIVREFGKPTLFMTMTCNPEWPEIQEALYEHQKADARPDLVSRVFHCKFQECMNDIVKKEVFGKVLSYVASIEFQKRGLPHSHVLIILDPGTAPRTPAEYDGYVCAELPNPIENEILFNLASKFMIHGPCGIQTRISPCMMNSKCSKGFPRKFEPTTRCDESGYPVYQRRDNGRSTLKNGVEVDNRWVVPYNPYLLRKYTCHINLEICSTVKSIKYLYKYVYKGLDRAVISIQRSNEEPTIHPEVNNQELQTIDVDEIQNYLSGRYISPPEACWRIFGFHPQEKSHTVMQLAVHLEGRNSILFNSETTREDLANAHRTTLIEFFKLCANNNHAADILYNEAPRHFTWVVSNKSWKIRGKRFGRSIGRMVSVSPKDEERFYLRLLLCYVRGPKSFKDLRTYEGVVHQTYKMAAFARGLLEDDGEWVQCMEEAIEFGMPRQLRRLFASILNFCNPSNPRRIWLKCNNAMSEDFQRQLACDAQDRRTVYLTLKDIDRCLHINGSSLSEHMELPQLDEFQDIDDASLMTNQLIDVERSYDRGILQQQVDCVSQLNRDQLNVYNRIIESLHGDVNDKLFFIDGPGGTGKSFLFQTILATARLEGVIALAVASSGIASIQLQGGRTAHSMFKLPLNLISSSTCNIPAQSDRAKLLRECSLIVWDEAPMMVKHAFKALDITLRDLMGANTPFGGKIVVLAGDFRQILPVIPRATPSEVVGSCLCIDC